MAMPEEALEPMNEEEFSQVFQIMTASFPKDERRDEQGQRRLLQEKEYEILVCRQEGRVVAFFAVWNMEPMLYIEHFAVTQEKRGSGLGRKLLQGLCLQAKRPVILEVEPPETDIAKRRIGFYEREGFYLNPYPYIQPPMTKETKAIPLMIMSWPEKIDQGAFQSYRRLIYRHVYQVKETDIP